MTVREVRPHDVQFMVNPMPVKGKRYRGRPVYSSCNHINRQGQTSRHPYAFDFVVIDDTPALGAILVRLATELQKAA